MRLRIRVLGLAAFALLGLGVLVGCSGGGASDDGGSSDDSSSTAGGSTTQSSE